MPESPEELHARVVAQVGSDGRLPVADVVTWEVFPWEIVEGELRTKVLAPPVAVEADRAGKSGTDCAACEPAAGAVRVWESWNFHLVRPERPSGLPIVLWLNANDHVDFHELSDDQAAEFGKLSVWLTRIIQNLPHIGRVHVNRWGDGAEHCHAWFIARPERFPAIRGSLAVEWDEVLPPAPEDVWRADVEEIARKLAMHEGHTVG